ncbi:hypothetical protein Leryth_000442 [Lithospermum erythrorhizon]|nr:hypothetical protein Leryth_000442 [Lithospermum erythrorhizon]
MGAANSKTERTPALGLCKERKKFVKQAIDSRYALAAAHVSYVQSLKSIGIALRRYAEAEVLIESSTTEVDKTTSHLTDPSPLPSHVGGVSDSPLINGSPHSPIGTRLSYMRSMGAGAVTVMVRPPPRNVYVDDIEFSTPPPPPPPEFENSWDFFDPVDDPESFSFAGHNGGDGNFVDASMFGQLSEKTDDLGESNGPVKEHLTSNSENQNNEISATSHDNESNDKKAGGNESRKVRDKNRDNTSGTLVVTSTLEQSSSKNDKLDGEKQVHEQQEDPSDFITHRAKDFLASIKDIEHRFFRASESGKEVSRMLEANKIRVGYSDAKAKSPASIYLASLGPACCQRGINTSSEEAEHVTKVITWKRTTSSRSSSSRNPLTSGKDDNDDSSSDFFEEFCMIAGSHSSSMDRLYAWERKLSDEVKASESIKKEYDRKCGQLRQQFAKDASTQVIDRIRSVVKDLHSRIGVGLHSIDVISKRIEKIRDDELLPQLLELLQGLIRMWKAMLECHHSQYIILSLAYHAKQPSAGIPQADAQKLIMAELQEEMECFGLSFADWINSLTLYVEGLNSWLQNCILLPQERSRGRRAFSPRRLLGPPIFVLCRDLSSGIKSLPSQEVIDAVRSFLYDLRHQPGEAHKKETTPEPNENGDSEVKADENSDRSPNLSSMHISLTKVLDQLTKFSEASRKMFEDVKQKCETARTSYLNYRAPPRAFSI